MKRFVLFTFLFYLVFLFLSFGNLPKTFFQQDEWALFGYHIAADKLGINLFDRLFIYEQKTHLIPLSNLVTFLQYRLFGVNFVPYALLSLVTHFANSILAFFLARKLTKNHWAAFFSGLLFLTNSISHQAVTWIATTTGTATSTTAVLISLLYFVDKKLMLSIFFFLVSLLFKETSIFLFFFYPIAWFLVHKKNFILQFGLVGFGYLLLRLYFWGNEPLTSEVAALAQPPLPVYVFRAFAIPIRMIAQSFLPVRFHLTLARQIIFLVYPQFAAEGVADPYLVESVASDIVSFFVAIAVILFAILVRRKTIMFLSLLFILVSALPFVVVPGRAGYNALLDGRHLYLTSIFSSIFLATIFWKLLVKVKKIKLVTFALATVFFLAFSYHILKIRRDVAYQVAVGGLRRSMLEKIRTAYPTLPQRVAFFVESDAPYYGLPYEEPIVPFQSGFGQTLLVWYNSHGAALPACFFDKGYLYDLLSEDFKECEGRAFGYYRKQSTFRQAVKKYNLKPEEIITFRFISSMNELKPYEISFR